MQTILSIQLESELEQTNLISLFAHTSCTFLKCSSLHQFEKKLTHGNIDGILLESKLLSSNLITPSIISLLQSKNIPIFCVITNQQDTLYSSENPIKLSGILRTYKDTVELQQDVHCFAEVVKNASSRNNVHHSSTETVESSTWLDQKELLRNLANHVPGMLFQFVFYPDGTMNCPYVSKGVESLFEIYDYKLPIEFDFMLSRIHPEDKESFIESIHHSINNLSFWENTYRVVLPNQGIRWIRATSQPQKFRDGRIVWYGYAYDITEKKKAEKLMLRSQRLESIGTLAGGIAHDLNNILTPILTSAELLKLKITDEKLIRLLAIIETASKRGAEMVQQVLSFTKGVVGTKVPINFNYLIKELTLLIMISFPKNVTIKSIFDENLPLILGDYIQLEQVLLNLCVNARDAMSKGGSITIHCKKFDVNNDMEFQYLGLKKGVYLQLNVTDTGCGMTSEVKDRLFEPFFTTKEIGFGTGLGLPTVLSIVTAHKGVINVISEIDKGTNCQVYLPTSNMKEILDEIPTIIDFNANGEVAIIVDQEDAIRGFTKEALETMGFTVAEAKTGKHAMEILEKEAPASILLITDLLMPVEDGLSIINEAKKRNPKIKIIAVSGLIDSSIPLEKYLDIIYLQKPYTTQQLLKAVVSLLKK